MDNKDELARVREYAQIATSRSRAESDPALRKQWSELAANWTALLEQLEASGETARSGGKKR
jgi:hypothetical protein